MKRNVKAALAWLAPVRRASDYFSALILILVGLPSLLTAQTLQNRYSFATDASDSVGGANGTLVAGNNPATISGGLSLPGTGTSGTPSGYVSLPNGIVSGDTSVTVECWVTQNSANTWSEVWSFGTSGGGNNFGLITAPPTGRNGGNMIVAFTPGNGHGEVDLNTPTTFPSGTEQYVAVTYNNNTLVGNLYLNGVLDGTVNLPSTNYSPGNFGITPEDDLGRDPYGPDAMFSGTLYELRIWNGAVSQRYVAASALLGPSVLPNSLTPTAINVTAGAGLVLTGTEQASVTVELSETGTNNLPATGDATNWMSSNPNVLTVNSSGLISAVGVGTATVSATVAGHTGTTGSITVTSQVLAHRYSFATDATDSVGGANGQLVAGTSGTNASINNGLSLPGNTAGGFGNTGYVSLPNGILTNTTSLTVECWLTQNQANTWATPWDFGNNGNQNFALIPHPGNNGNNMEVAFTPNGGEVDLQSAAAFPTGTEQYVALTYNNSTLVGNLYTNGALDATRVFPSTAYCPGGIGGANGTGSNMLGNDVYGDQQFDGTIYEFRIWSGALSPLYTAVAAAAGPTVVVSSLTASGVTLTVTNTSLVGTETEQATVTANFAAASGVNVTGGATNWTSSNTNILTVSSSGLITAINGGSATISATVAGVTATSASITVAVTKPVITQQPLPATAPVGGSVTFTVVAVGGNLTYQWSEGATPIPGATTATLTLANLTLGQSGLYSVLVTNTLGSTNSVSVALTVVNAILEHRYSFASDASDSVGGANGTLVAGSNPATISSGLFLPGSGTTAAPSGYVALPNGLVSGDTNVTVECWLTQNAAQQWAEAWSFGYAGGSGNFGLIPAPAPGRNNGNLLVAFTAPGIGETDLNTPTTFPNGTEQYVAVTYNNATLTGSLYLNGTLDGTVVFPDGTHSPGTFGITTDDTFGLDPYGGDAQFSGTIYEVRIWNGVISPLYLAVTAAANNPSVVETDLTPTSVTLTVTNTTMIGSDTQQASVTANFADASGVVVTGAATNWTSSNTNILTVNSSGLITAVSGGSATVSATVGGVIGTSASITVSLTKPAITQAPVSESLYVGQSAIFTVAALGGQLSYQWSHGANPIAGATTSSLILPDLSLSEAGNYTVTITNSDGSTNATVSLAVAEPGLTHRWSFNEANGATTASDSIGGADGTLMGSSSFDGNGNIILPDTTTTSLSANASFVLFPPGIMAGLNSATVEVWAADNGPHTWAEIWSFGGNTSFYDGVTDTTNYIGFVPNSGVGDMRAAFKAGNGTEEDVFWPNTTMPVNVEEDVTLTYDNTVTTAYLYLNGELVGINTNITITPSSLGNAYDNFLGRDQYNDPIFQGTVDELRIYAGPLSPTDVANNHLGGPNTLVSPGTQNDVGLTIQTSGTNVILTWPIGMLLQAPTVQGPWTTNTAATSPYTLPSTTNQTEFFKVQVYP